MKKGNGIRRILAVMLAVVMIFGTSLTSLADAGVDVVEDVTTAVEKVTEAVAEIMEEKTTAASTEATTSASTEKATETTTVATTEISTNASTESTTEQSTKASTEATTDANTEEATTEVSTTNTETTEASTEAPITTEVEMVELTQTVDGTTITLSGSSSSFEPGKTYSIQVTKIEDDETIEAALEEAAEKEDKVVESYQAFDIILLADGVEVQPLGPVSVRFSGNQVAEAIANEETETKVLHVDDAGQTADMEATTEGEDVAIETTHFSIYVVVDMNQLGGTIDLTVQHWATIKRLNGVDNQDGLVSNVKIDGTAELDNPNAGSLNSENVFTEIYSTDTFELDNKVKRTVDSLSKLILADKENVVKSYNLKEIWVLKSGKAADSTDKTDWNIYQVANYTNSDHELTLTKNSVMRMVYEPISTDNAYKWDTTFYDYNVTDDGKIYANDGTTGGTVIDITNTTWNKYLKIGQTGINSASNYSGGTYSSNRITVGIASNGFKHGAAGVKLNGNYINRPSSDGITLATDMVKGYNTEGPVYNNLYDPGFFTSTNKIGKKILNGYKLGFNKQGDTYTLATVYGPNGTRTLTNLDGFRETFDNGSRHILSNNFWPLDSENYDGQDPLFGGSYKFYNWADRGSSSKKDFGSSDDGQAHNWFFGMRYDFQFTIGDYTGPLNFYFRGDDDFWLFVDGVLRTDIGGQHSSVGKMLDLNDLKQGDKNKVHTISIFYMERGGYGSTCYMEFTLPNAVPISTTPVPKTDVTVNKNWVDENKANRPNSLDVELVRKSGNVEKVLDTVTLRPNDEDMWTYTWSELPLKDVNNTDISYSYYAREKNVPDGYQLHGSTTMGTITTITNIETIDINVEKIWDDYQYNNVRPTSIEVKLMDGDTQVGDTLTLNDANEWGKTVKVGWSDLPRYRLDANGNATIITYKVVETGVSDRYTTTYSPAEISADGKVTITNTLKVHSLKLLKYSALNENTFLKGAKFKLVSKEGYFADREISTDDNGVIKFEALPKGTYTLRETEAPEGYFLEDTVYNITVTDEGIIVNNEAITDKVTEKGVIYHKLGVANSPLYELPSTGGSGIYWLMMAGLVLMMVATYINYRSRCKVLVRK